jgi:predicted site-specific integrase-resolvase
MEVERKETKMRETCLNQIELAARWKISHRTLERWRWTGDGPSFIKLGGRVIYRLEDVEAFEREALKDIEDGSRHR